jgi:hypothetical protein
MSGSTARRNNMFGNAKLGMATFVTVASTAVIAGVASGHPSATSPPATVSATALASTDTGPFYAHRGSLVRSSQLGIRSFVNAENGFALASVGQAQYPANTTDGGKTWRIDGPHFHKNAANAPNVITRTDVAGRSTYFAYAGPGGGMMVVVSTDAGKHWWQAYLPGVPLTVEPTFTSGKLALVTIVENGPGQFLAYLSSDGGRHWRYHKGFI